MRLIGNYSNLKGVSPKRIEKQILLYESSGQWRLRFILTGIMHSKWDTKQHWREYIVDKYTYKKIVANYRLVKLERYSFPVFEVIHNEVNE